MSSNAETIYRKTSEIVPGITSKRTTSKIQRFKIRNEHDLASDVIHVVHLDDIPSMLYRSQNMRTLKV